MTDETTTQRDAERLAHIREKYRGLQGDMPPFGDVLILLRLLDARDVALREAQQLIDQLQEKIAELHAPHWPDAAPAQPGAEHVQRAKELADKYYGHFIGLRVFMAFTQDLAAALAAAEQRGYARAREDAALALEQSEDHHTITTAAAMIRALARPPAGEPR